MIASALPFCFSSTSIGRRSGVHVVDGYGYSDCGDGGGGIDVHVDGDAPTAPEAAVVEEVGLMALMEMCFRLDLGRPPKISKSAAGALLPRL